MAYVVKYKRSNMKKWKHSLMMFSTKAGAKRYVTEYVKHKYEKNFQYRIYKASKKKVK